MQVLEVELYVLKECAQRIHFGSTEFDPVSHDKHEIWHFSQKGPINESKYAFVKK